MGAQEQNDDVDLLRGQTLAKIIDTGASTVTVTQQQPRAERAVHVPLVFAGLMLGMLVASLSQTIVSPAMPRIAAGICSLSIVVRAALIIAIAPVPEGGGIDE